MAAQSNPRAIPDGYHTITPYLTVKGAAAALEFYGEAFGAVETFRLGGPEGKLAHAEMRIGDSPFMLADEVEQWGNRSPLTLGGNATSLMIYVEDVDSVFQRAVDAGAEVVMPVENQFWGDRSGTVKDPFGHSWMISSHVEDVSPEELDRRMKEMMSQT